MQIHSLIKDIDNIVVQENWFTDELGESFAKEVSARLKIHYNDQRASGTLRMSGLGPKCPRALWYSVHHPELAEPLPASAIKKYSFGHIIEAQTIMFAKAAGHIVTGEQDVLELDGILGHRDCVIDGCVVDVKSTSSIGFGKFQTRNYAPFDSFGYLEQLDAYVVASSADPLVTVHDKGYILAVDKQLGKMHLYEHTVRPEHIAQRIKEYKHIVGHSNPPPCMCGTVKHGESGNIKLDTRASYSAYKYCCFPHLRTFLYKEGPVYLTVVKRRPQRQDGSYVTEVDKAGRVVYH